ncbi:MAG: isoprenylcysteine carboxylmethyltransferase family protein [Devosia sp.]|nr:isoprenylcysteine carboxylmethyltransferase family protein [Devosia sp.]
MGIVDGLRAGLATTLPMAALLLVPAGLVPGGTWVWPAGLAFIAVTGAISIGGNIALAVHKPANFKVRRQGVIAKREKRQPLADAVGAAVLIAFGAAWLVFVPCDVFRLHLLGRPTLWVSALGAVCVVVGAALTPLAVWENEFATPNVQDQTGASQRVIDTGVYALVRHPIYAGNLLLFGGAALWLGSYAAFLSMGVLLVATIGRIVVEEAHLGANLPGYAEYSRRVRSRLIPWVI